MNWPSSALDSWALQLVDMIETKQFGDHTSTDCRKCRADRIYRDLLESKALCETHEKKEEK